MPKWSKLTLSTRGFIRSETAWPLRSSRAELGFYFNVETSGERRGSWPQQPHWGKTNSSSISLKHLTWTRFQIKSSEWGLHSVSRRLLYWRDILISCPIQVLGSGLNSATLLKRNNFYFLFMVLFCNFTFIITGNVNLSCFINYKHFI